MLYSIVTTATYTVYYIFSYDTQEDANLNTLVVAESTGSVLWIPQAVTRSRCTREDQEWLCTLKFGSWIYEGSLLDMAFYEGSEEVELSDYIVSHWNVVGNSAVRDDKYYPCCPVPYPYMLFTLRFSRNPSISNSSTSSNYGNGVLFLTTYMYVILKWFFTN